MKKNYQKPTLQVVQLQQQTQVLQASSGSSGGYDVIAPGQPNEPAAARAYRGQWDDDGWDTWEE